jgi:hypothetical protein
LHDDEKLFVEEYGSECVRFHTDVKKNEICAAYRTKFPGFIRNAELLKAYWKG